MARIFPDRRRRAVAAVAAGSLLMTIAALPPATAADDLRDRKNRVKGDISKTLVDLDQSSEQVLAATRALEAAQARLSAAEQQLAETRGELAAAEVLDRRMQAALRRAVLRLREARKDLVRGREEVAAQEDILGQVAVQNYQQGDPGLLGLSAVLTSHDPADLTSQLSSVKSILDKESVTLDRLDATRVLLTVKEQEVEEARQEVAVKRQKAAENLLRKQQLEEQAEVAQEAVAALVTASEEARDTAVDARRADLKKLRGLQQERDRVSDMLAARAEAARLRAEAAAAAATASAAVARTSNGFLDYPVDGYITSPYGMRLHPVYKRWTLHDGVDFGAPCGTPIRAAASGQVIAVYYNAGYGKRVIMDNGFHRGVGLGTAYNHLSAYDTYVGENVRRGDVIGFVGNTGYSTGCHLHFMVFEDGAAVDPMGWL